MRTLNKDLQSEITPEIALKILKDGNKRFVSQNLANRDLISQVADTTHGQWPFATILGCIDSRVSNELVFDQGIGDIFSIRIAGNVVNTDILGSMEFACKVAGAKLIVVLGHSACGAVKGACDHVEMGNLTELLSKIQPALYEEKETISERNSQNKDFVENVARINVKRNVNSVLERSPILKEMIDKGEIGLIGAMYDVATGKVEFYDDPKYM